MPFSVSWYTLLDEAEDLPDGTTLVTPLTDERFRITDTQEHRVIIELQDSGDARPLQREQFERLYENLQETDGAFDRSPGSERAIVRCIDIGRVGLSRMCYLNRRRPE